MGDNGKVRKQGLLNSVRTGERWETGWKGRTRRQRRVQETGEEDTETLTGRTGVKGGQNEEVLGRGD